MKNNQNTVKKNNSDNINNISNNYFQKNTDKLRKELEGDNYNKYDLEDEKEIKDKTEETKEFIIELKIYSKIIDKENKNENLNNSECNRNDYLKDEDENSFKKEKEIITSIEIPIIRESSLNENEKNNIENKNVSNDDEFYIKINDLVKIMKNKGYPLNGSKINIFINFINNYVLINDEKEFLNSSFLGPNKNIIKMKIINYIDKKLIEDTPSKLLNHYLYKKRDNKDKHGKINLTIPDSHKRERKIGYIIEKVYAWRKLFNGYHDENGNYIKYSLDEASERVGVPKKSLDDYLTQMRLGRKHGFDFNKNKDKVIAVLRDFVKKKENKKTDNKNINVNEDNENY